MTVNGIKKIIKKLKNIKKKNLGFIVYNIRNITENISKNTIKNIRRKQMNMGKYLQKNIVLISSFPFLQYIPEDNLNVPVVVKHI